ncbi:MAG: hypothetical protein ACI4U9_01330 [Clostridia bacterium]
MIGKGKLFDIISRTADDVNNMDVTNYTMLENFKARKEKFDKQISNQNDWER